ncbi:hypothetical protein APHAL10511_000799 [Amanita phalloides]|nr:hypothetical protein APHAL10511_000799 [Amanita phalloides]
MSPKIGIAAVTIALLSQLVYAQTPQTPPQTPPFIGNLLVQPAVNGAMCMTAASNSNGAAVTIQSCRGTAAQYWAFTGGQVKVFGNKCLAVPNGGGNDGTKLEISTCSGSPNQSWSYTWWSNQLSWTSNHSKCMDLSGGHQAAGTPIQIWPCAYGNPNQSWDVGYLASALPYHSQEDQYGYNSCGTGSNQTSNCQTMWFNSADDFCLWAPPHFGKIGDTERYEVAWCTKSGRGTRVIPNGTLKGVHFTKTPDYVEVTGVGDFTKLNIPKGDDGGELDNRGGDGKGNPIGGLVYGNSFGPAQQYHEWTSFISDSQFCFRACVGAKATELCQHIYDEMGCYWNMPDNYAPGVYENCEGDDDLPMGVYGTSTFHQGDKSTPPPHLPAKTSNCHALPSVSVTPADLKKRSLNRLGYEALEPRMTPAPM